MVFHWSCFKVKLNWRRDRKRSHAYPQRDGWPATTKQTDSQTERQPSRIRCGVSRSFPWTAHTTYLTVNVDVGWNGFLFCWHLLKMQIFDRTKLVQRERMFKLERTTLCRSKQIGSPSCNYLHLPCRRTTISFWTERGVVKQDLQQRQQQPESGVWHRHRLKDSSISRSWMSCCENRFPPLWFRNDDRERYRNTIDYRHHR